MLYLKKLLFRFKDKKNIIALIVLIFSIILLNFNTTLKLIIDFNAPYNDDITQGGGVQF